MAKPTWILCCYFAFGWAVAQGQELDGPKHIFDDPLLNNMLGSWTLSGNIANRPARHSVQAEWVLNHQFLRIHEKDDAPSTNGLPGYEALVMVGYDNMSERYVVHWLDIYGGRFSETLGYGSRKGNDISLTFEYPDGPFHTTFRWKPDAKRWEWTMEAKNKEGNWTQFAAVTLVPAGKR